MSRYIEEEAIIKAIDESGRKYGITTANQCNFKEIVRKTPTADVVPKSEVEKLIIDRNAARLGMIAEHERLKTARAKVAREIFEEIDNILNDYKLAERGLRLTQHGVPSIDQRYADLKKKYTEKCTDCKHFVGCEKANWVRGCEDFKH